MDTGLQTMPCHKPSRTRLSRQGVLRRQLSFDQAGHLAHISAAGEFGFEFGHHFRHVFDSRRATAGDGGDDGGFHIRIALCLRHVGLVNGVFGLLFIG